MPLFLAPGIKLVAATHNPGKAVEIAALLEGRFDIVTAGELGLPEPEETEATFVGNAVLKARAAADASGLVALADDSGLSVTALGGGPGIHTARYAVRPDGKRDFAWAMSRLEADLGEAADRSAWFTCALAVAWPDGPVVAVEGRAYGTVCFPPRGSHGHGYDPVFLPRGGALTFAEMDPAEKDRISHRAHAFQALKAALF